MSFQSPQFDIEKFNTKLARSPTVFIGNQSGHDFSCSTKYGKPVYITTGLLDRFAVGFMYRCWADHLQTSKREDFILVTSLTILTVIGAALFGHLHGRINLLLFKNNKYIQRTIIFESLKEAPSEHD